MDVFKKLLKLKTKIKKNISLIIIRLDKKGKLCNSHPCEKCINYMVQIAKQRKYKIKNIYYSNNDGNIEHTTLAKLDNLENKHISKRFKNV